MRSISRVADVSINTVSKLLVEAGEACLALHDETVRKVKASGIQCDEIWSGCHAKQKNVVRMKTAPEGAGDTPAMAAGITDRLWSLEDVLARMRPLLLNVTIQEAGNGDMSERLKIVLIVCGTALAIALLVIYFSPYQTCVRAAVSDGTLPHTAAQVLCARNSS